MGSDLTEREEVKYKLKPSMMRESLMNSFEFNHHAGLALSHDTHHGHNGQRAGG
ncbi:MAG TPA: hypothetical protein VF779_00335 [Pyrinomonadaceae bacterium]|jgi:hypothetical protein